MQILDQYDAVAARDIAAHTQKASVFVAVKLALDTHNGIATLGPQFTGSLLRSGCTSTLS